MFNLLGLCGVFFLSLFFSGCAELSVVKNKFSSTYSKKEIVTSTPKSQFTFSWSYTDSSSMKPRGGTTLGQNVTLDKNINKNWKALREKKFASFRT
jgi:hypothetical protein